jgi:hypothetical protein
MKMSVIAHYGIKTRDHLRLSDDQDGKTDILVLVFRRKDKHSRMQ